MTRRGRSKPGMNELATIVLDMQRDIKRMKSVIAPQSAAQLVAKHNATNPRSPWKLLKVDANGPDTIDNMRYLNNDGIPDVVITNKDDNPIIVNGYTTKQGRWPDDLMFYNAFPTREARRQERERLGVDKFGRDEV